MPAGEVTISVVVTYPDGSTEDIPVSVSVGQPDTPVQNPDWADTAVVPGGDSTELPNTGGPVTDGTTVSVDGPGEATLNGNGSIMITPNPDAKDGDTITEPTGSGDDGNGGSTGGSTGSGSTGGLARTGTEAGGLVAAALGMLGAGWALVRRRRNNDET